MESIFNVEDLFISKYLWNTSNKNIHSFPLHVQSSTIPCCSQELLPFLSVIYFFLPFFSNNYSSILSHPILPSISWSTSQSCYSQIHIQYSFQSFIFSILCTCPNKCNLFNLVISIMIGFLTLAYISLLVYILKFSISLSNTGPKILLYTFPSKKLTCFLSLFVSA